ncbi:MAG TPA: IS1182 family transposase [Actinophytocola sp.]|uniref:IS1182 family transposase n=1 Tax=Actinophytocola sp. TaxID=1872138 RepID=UPI002E081D90|nr:IS1182 family transposase [Actinophytocola sp.]
MSLGEAPKQLDLLDAVTRFCDESLPDSSIYGFLFRERDRLFPDEMFADLFAVIGRRSVPPSVVATVMVLQRLEGLSDREAVDRFTFDARWRYAAGVGGWDGAGPTGFAHTVLVDMRERLRGSDRPDRVFEVALTAAREAGLVGRRRVLDSTPLYDSVTTMDTVTLIRSAIRGLLNVADPVLEQRLRAVLTSGDQYVTAGKPVVDWDDEAARTALVDARAQDGYALLEVLEGQKDLPEPVNQAAKLLATVLGQDLEPDPDNPGGWRIARRVAKDRVISTVDTEARHGHKTNHRGYDGFKGHLALDPDSEIITAVAVTPANTGDVEPVADLIADLTSTDPADPPEGDGDPAAVYGDSAYGAGEVLERLDNAGLDSMTKVQPPVAPGGKFTKDQFDINLEARTVTCPNGITIPIRPVRGNKKQAGKAEFGLHCRTCPLADMCTDSKTGRRITIGPHEARLTAARARQRDQAWKADYQATRPKVERKLAHLMRRRHGGRRARMRGTLRIAADFALLAAAVNLARLARLGLAHTHGAWTLNPA